MYVETYSPSLVVMCGSPCDVQLSEGSSSLINTYINIIKIHVEQQFLQTSRTQTVSKNIPKSIKISSNRNQET